MAALRAGFAERARWPRVGPRPDLQARRHAGGLGGAGRLDTPAPINAPAYASYLSPHAVRSASANCAMYQRVYQRITHGIGMMNMQPIVNTMVRHSTSSPEAVK